MSVGKVTIDWNEGKRSMLNDITAAWCPNFFLSLSISSINSVIENKHKLLIVIITLTDFILASSLMRYIFFNHTSHSKPNLIYSD